MKEKELYEKPVVEVIEVDDCDIITSSGNNSGNSGINLPIDPFYP